MTRTTSSRQLRETIGAVLKANGIDDLKTEADVCSAVTRFLEETRAGRDPVKVREEIAAHYWQGVEEQQPFAKMRERMMNALDLNIPNSSEWDGIVSFCLARKDETIEKYAEFCRANPYSMPKPFQIAQKPSLIRDTWPQAFAQKETVSEYRQL